MRFRIIVLFVAASLLLIVAACGGAPAAPKVPTLPAIPTKTPRPTFTHTPVLPTATRLVPTATVPPTVTPVTPSPTVEATASEAKAILKANAVANARWGPGTAYPKIGQLQEGQEYEVTGKNADGDWWQFAFDGKSGWVAASMVTANDAAASVAVAEAPAAPAPAPAPVQQAPAPAPAPAPTNPPAAPAKQYAASSTNPLSGQADRITVRCRLVADVSKVQDRYTNRTGTIRVTGPTSAAPVKFGAYLTWANAGLPKESRYLYQTNPDCKVELPFGAGTYTAVILDDSGTEISDPIQFTPSGNTTEFFLVWNPRQTVFVARVAIDRRGC